MIRKEEKNSYFRLCWYLLGGCVFTVPTFSCVWYCDENLIKIRDLTSFYSVWCCIVLGHVPNAYLWLHIRNRTTQNKQYINNPLKILSVSIVARQYIYTGSNFGGVNMELFCFYLHAFAYIKLFKPFLLRNVFFVHSTSIVVLFMVVKDLYIFFFLFLCDIFVPIT